jgi:type I restriction enzyme S subunit
LNQHIFRVVPDNSKVIKDYLRHMLTGALVDMEEHLHGATMKHVNRGEFLSTKIPLPPLEEQRRIAAILDKADELRIKRRQALAHLDALTQSIFHSMFGDLANERQIPLRDAVAPGTIVTYGIVQAGDEYPSGVPYVRTGDIRNGRIDQEGLRRTDPAIAAKFARSRIAAGDIVMSIRATVGTVALTPQELDGANLTQGTARIAPGLETEASYLLEYLRTPRVQQWIQKQVKGATFKEITLDRLRQLPVSIPRKADQLSFGRAVSAVEKLKGKHHAHLSDLEILFASLQDRAFRGEL